MAVEEVEKVRREMGKGNFPKVWNFREVTHELPAHFYRAFSRMVAEPLVLLLGSEKTLFAKRLAIVVSYGDTLFTSGGEYHQHKQNKDFHRF